MDNSQSNFTQDVLEHNTPKLILPIGREVEGKEKGRNNFPFARNMVFATVGFSRLTTIIIHQ